jgi:hypothetical protein
MGALREQQWVYASGSMLIRQAGPGFAKDGFDPQ